MEKVIHSKKYGEITVRAAMLELDDNTTLVDGIELKGDYIGLIEIYRHYYLEDLTEYEVDILIEANI